MIVKVVFVIIQNQYNALYNVKVKMCLLYDMIENYIHTLMENLPPRTNPLKINLVLGGGAFNGSYILGALYFFKELERSNYIKINKISCCSVSSVLGLLYLTDNLDKANTLYLELIQSFKENKNLSKIYELKTMLQQSNIDVSKLNRKLYICYNNIQTCKKEIKSKFNNIDYLFEIITRSCYIPLLVDLQLTYKNKYIDGMIPYFFQNQNHKTIFIDVYTLDKLYYSIHIKNEKSNTHRLLEGALDIHRFFIKNCNTTMCSDVNKWSIYYYIVYYLYIIIEMIIIRIVYYITQCTIANELIHEFIYNNNKLNYIMSLLLVKFL